MSLPNCICFHPSEPAGAIPRCCSISRLCLFRIPHQQKENAAPAQRADNICEPIIYPVEDLNIPCSVVFKICCHLVALRGGTRYSWSSQTRKKTIDTPKNVLALHRIANAARSWLTATLWSVWSGSLDVVKYSPGEFWMRATFRDFL